MRRRRPLIDLVREHGKRCRSLAGRMCWAEVLDPEKSQFPAVARELRKLSRLLTVTARVCKTLERLDVIKKGGE